MNLRNVFLFALTVSCSANSASAQLNKIVEKLDPRNHDPRKIVEVVLGTADSVAKGFQNELSDVFKPKNVRYPVPGHKNPVAFVPDGDGTVVQIRCVHGFRNLDLGGNNVYAHDDNHAKANQKWRIKSAPIDGHPQAVRITCEANGESLDMRLDKSFNIYTHESHNGSNQRFLLVRMKGNAVYIVCCAVLGRSFDKNLENNNVYAFTTHKGKNQQWLLIP